MAGISEARVLEAMISLHCRHCHGSPRARLCPECAGLLAYALHRLERCPFAPCKPTCRRCTVHCYAPAMRERIRRVMRYAGPRMIFHHPIMAITHLLHERRR